MFGIGGCEDVWSSIFFARRHGKREHQIKGYVAEQKVERRMRRNRGAKGDAGV